MKNIINKNKWIVGVFILVSLLIVILIYLYFTNRINYISTLDFDYLIKKLTNTEKWLIGGSLLSLIIIGLSTNWLSSLIYGYVFPGPDKKVLETTKIINDKITYLSSSINEFKETYEFRNITNIQDGKLLHDIPNEMEIDVETKCTIRLAENTDILLKGHKESEYSTIIDIKYSNSMYVELIDLNSKTNFSIRLISTKEQLIIDNDFTEWLFFVKPLNIGNHTLILKVSIIQEINKTKKVKESVLELKVDVNTKKKEINRIWNNTNILINTSTNDTFEDSLSYKCESSLFNKDDNFDNPFTITEKEGDDCFSTEIEPSNNTLKKKREELRKKLLSGKQINISDENYDGGIAVPNGKLAGSKKFSVSEPIFSVNNSNFSVSKSIFFVKTIILIGVIISVILGIYWLLIN